MPASTSAMLRRGVIGRRIRLLRARLDLSSDEFAHRYEFPPDQFRRWEAGRELPSDAIIEKLIAIDRGSGPTEGPSI